MPAPSHDRAKALLQHVLVLARATRGAEAVASLSATHAGNTRFAVNEITSSSDVDRQQLSLTMQFGLRSATATTNQLDARALDDLVARARRMALIAPENPEAMPAPGRQVYRPAPGASHGPTAAFGPAARAKAVASAIGAGDAAKVAIAGFYEHEARMHALASSAGLWAHHAWTNVKLTCTARTADATGSGWAGTSSHRAADLDAAALAKTAVAKAVRSATPTRLEPGRYTVVLEPTAVAELLGFLTGALGARRADEGRSFFSKPGGSTRLGEKLFPETITLRSDPTDPQLTAMPFDREGLPLAPTTWIDKGVIRGLAYGRYWAKQQGKPPTGQPAGWILDGNKTTALADLVKGVKRGVLITRLWYLRALDPQSLLVTGLTRDGTFLIENGAVTRPVMNFRFNDSPVQMLKNCDAMSGGTIASGMRVPALRTNEFNLASISEAV